jgi:hypothetical protein
MRAMPRSEQGLDLRTLEPGHGSEIVVFLSQSCDHASQDTIFCKSESVRGGADQLVLETLFFTKESWVGDCRILFPIVPVS